MPGGNNIEALRTARGWSRPELARQMGTSAQQVERLEKGQRRLTQDWMEKAAGALGVAPIEIISPDALPTSIQPMQRVESVVASHNTFPLKQIDMSFSMGPGSNIDDYVEEGAIEFDANLLRSITRAPPERLLVAKGQGDSMFPTLINDDMVVIDTTQRVLNLHDRIWACAVHGAGAIKRLRAVGKRRVEVISDNPTVANQEVDGEDLLLFGRVVWIGRKV